MTNFFVKIGHGFKQAAHKIEPVAVKSGYAVTELMPIVLPLLPGGMVAGTLLQGSAVLQLLHGEKNPMNPLEQFAVMMIMSVIQTTVKNPAHKAAVQTQLLGVADDIYMSYGMIPPPRPETGDHNPTAAAASFTNAAGK